MKFDIQDWEVINELLEQEYNSCDDEERRAELKQAMSALDSIGYY